MLLTNKCIIIIIIIIIFHSVKMLIICNGNHVSNNAYVGAKLESFQFVLYNKIINKKIYDTLNAH